MTIKNPDGSEVADGAMGPSGLTGDALKCQPSRLEGETTRPAGVAPGPSGAPSRQELASMLLDMWQLGNTPLEIVNQILARTFTLAQTAAWQPIETAPKDGTPVDLFSVSGRRWCDYRWDKEIRSGMWSLASAAGLHWKDRPSLPAASMTHWMPVPASPVSSTDRSPIMQAADKAARVVEGWSDAKRDYADRVTDSSPVGWGGHLPGKIEP